jgi:hypothetical protein
MNVRIASLVAALALLASTNVCAADQPGGRSSVYATPGPTRTPPKVDKTESGNGRGSVYARDLPPPTPRDKVPTVVLKPGRA